MLALRRRTRAQLEQGRGSGADLMCGVLLGDRRRVAGTDTESDFRSLGLSHLLAVSGDHLAIACAVAAMLLRRAGASRRVTLLGAVFAGAAFAVFTGVQYSAVRALAMLAAGTAAGLAGRRSDGLSALALAMLVVAAAEPPAVFDVGMQLSVLAVGGLALFGSLATEWAEAALGPLRKLAGPVAMTLAAQAATAPVAVATFGMFSLAAPLANAVVVPLVSAGLVAGLAAGVVGWVLPRAASPLLTVASLPMRAATLAASLMARAPGGSVPVPASWVLPAVVSVTGAVLVWHAWPRPGSPRAARQKQHDAAVVAGPRL
ncbi:ComEC/Rec2 family competence protein, partial [bacterium]